MSLRAFKGLRYGKIIFLNRDWFKTKFKAKFAAKQLEDQRASCNIRQYDVLIVHTVSTTQVSSIPPHIYIRRLFQALGQGAGKRFRKLPQNYCLNIAITSHMLYPIHIEGEDLFGKPILVVSHLNYR